MKMPMNRTSGGAMETAERMALVEQTLVRAAEQVGDLTAPVMERYYHRCPEARASFDSHALGDRRKLEGQMVENAVYCLMYWFGSPGEVEIMLIGSVSHHNDTLHVPPEWYSALIEATADIVGDTIPAENVSELETWKTLRTELGDLVMGCRRYFHHA
jgi:hypothetical protein